MYYIYVLQSRENGYLYTGCTKDLKNRMQLHSTGKVPSTKKFLPMRLIYCELMLNRSDAFNREKFLKSGWGRNYVRRILSNFLSSKS